LGQKVDIKIINEFLPVCLRHEKDIRGKSGLLPIMFPGTFENEFDKKEKYRLEHDENGNIRPVLIYKQPSIKKVEEEIYSIQIAFDNSLSEDEMLKKSKQIISKEMKRRGVETYDINGCFEKVNTKIKLSINREITNSDSFISILKMAYEFAASNINGYVDDEKAIAIADVLKKASYSDALKYVSMRENSWGRGKFDKLFPDSHFIIVNCFDGILGALVSLHNIGDYTVKLSSKSFVINNKPSSKMLINNIKDKSYKIFHNNDTVFILFNNCQ
ncbi:TPA: HNH endonuclease, partial [Escherichia coli]|nr:HNH endonuclease [Escherichia coli]